MEQKFLLLEIRDLMFESFLIRTERMGEFLFEERNLCKEFTLMIEFVGDDNDVAHENVRVDDKAEPSDIELKKLIVFSGNDYMGLSSHPMVRYAASKAC